MDEEPSGYQILRLSLGLMVCLVGIVLVWNGVAYLQHRGKIKVPVQVIPEDSTLTLDGKQVRAGSVYMKPGVHTLKASRQYFTPVSKKLDTKSIGRSEIIYMLPLPESKDAVSWLQNHQDVQLQREAQGGAELAAVQSKTSKDAPFLTELPVIYGDGRGGFVRMATGAAIKPGNTPSVYVTAADPTLRQGALTYIRTRGYDPADTDIVFGNQSNPLERIDE